MDAETFSKMLTEAICRCDQFVWLYFEDQNLFGDKTGDWHKAIEAGKRNSFAKRVKTQSNKDLKAARFHKWRRRRLVMA